MHLRCPIRNADRCIHPAGANIDGPIDIPGKNDYRASIATEKKIDPGTYSIHPIQTMNACCGLLILLLDDIAQTYFDLHKQSKRCFTNEIVRPTQIDVFHRGCADPSPIQDIRTSLETW